MVNLTMDNIRAMMGKPSNIRNVAVIGHVSHGKSTLVDSLISKARIVPTNNTRNTSGTVVSQDKQDQYNTKSTSTPLYFGLPEESTKIINQETNGGEFLVNLIELPGYTSFSTGIANALRVTDGTLVILDCIDGLCVQTESTLRLALTEAIKPILVLNKLDRAIFELQLEKEELYQSLRRRIDNFNITISTYTDNESGTTRVDAKDGTVAFSSGLGGWAFTLRQFAEIYYKKFGVDKEKLMKVLWGDYYYIPESKRWITKANASDNNSLERSFNMLILDPIYRIFDTVMNSKRGELENLLERLNIQLNNEEKELNGKPLLNIVMRKFLPASDALLEMAVIHLPSPVTAQKYRAATLYEGPIDDEACTAIRKCDPNGPFMAYISKMVPISDSGRFYAFGRIFSGTARSGLKVRIQGPNYIPGKDDDLFIKPIESTIFVTGHYFESIEDCPAGNIIGFTGVDQFLLKSGTITTLETAFNIKTMKFSTASVVQVAVDVKNPDDLPKLIEGLKRLSKSDPLVQCFTSESGQHIISGTGELHLEMSIDNLQKEYTGVPIKASDLSVQYCETVQTESLKSNSSESPNNYNRIYMKVEPLDMSIVSEIEKGKISSKDDDKAISRYLFENHGWDINAGRRIWCFGPEDAGTNLLVDETKDITYLSEIKNSCNSAFQWATKEGALCGEKMRATCFNITDAVLHANAIHRGDDQIIPMCRRVIHGSQLKAEPTLLEPVYLVEIKVPNEVLSSAQSLISKRRGCIENIIEGPDNLVSILEGYLPVSESFGFHEALISSTRGRALPELTFSHWNIVPGSIYEPGLVSSIIFKIRERKGLKPEIPSPNDYLNKL